MDRMFVAAAYAAFACVALVVIRSDIRDHRIPNAVVLPGAGVISGLLAAAAWSGDAWDALARSALGACCLGAFYLLLWGIGRGRGMGGGDVKLAVPVGLFAAWHGWEAFAVGAASAFVLGGISSAVLIATGRATRRTRIAFAPFMLLGACLGPLLT